MVLEISCMLVFLPSRMDLCLRVVKLGFRAFGLNILSVYGEKCSGLLCDR